MTIGWTREKGIKAKLKSFKALFFGRRRLRATCKRHEGKFYRIKLHFDIQSLLLLHVETLKH